MRDSRFDILFEPIKIGPKTMKNRMYQVPHATGFGTAKPGSQSRFRGVRAEGGWGAVNVEYCSIHPEVDETPWSCATIWDDHDRKALQMVTDEAHKNGALAGLELLHGGRFGMAWGTRLVPAAPSPIAQHNLPYGVTYPRTLDEDDIREIQGWYAEAARKAVDIGFDIVYVYGAFSYLPMQFLSPEYNQRTDKYGGSLENRARFWLETLEAVNRAVGGQSAVAARISLDSMTPGGVTLEESLAVIRMADDLVDLWDVNIGSYNKESAEIAPSRVSPTYWMRDWTKHVKQCTRKPVLGVGRFTSPDLMADILRRGELDIIGGARPSISDPFLPQKIEEGRLEDIRECIGCNFCLQRAMFASHIACTQNATAGEEYRRAWHPERFTRAKNADKSVLVIGGGASGMECARVLAERQMEAVHIVEGGSALGGYAAMVASLPGLAEWRRVVDYRELQLKKLSNVEIVRDTLLDVDGALQYGADIVIVANGSHWARDGFNHVTAKAIPGHHLPHVLTPEDLLLTDAKVGKSVVVYDCDGHVMGAGVAELLSRRGHSVTLLTPMDRPAPYTTQTMESGQVRRSLREAGVEIVVYQTLERIEVDHCVVKGRGGERQVAADSVVLVTSRVADDALYRAIKANKTALTDNGVSAVHAIGDCVAPRVIADAIFDGHRLAREIDTDDPRWPLPVRREVLLG